MTLYSSSKIASLLLILPVLSGCAPRPATAVPTVQGLAATPTLVPSPLPPSPTMPFKVATVVVSPTPSLQPVLVAAVKGNLYIRRGPDVAFNPIAVLSAGEQETASARDVLEEWVQIPIPGQPDKSGWVSVQTTFSSVTGDIATLPEVMPTDWPVPAFLRNCTLHDLTAEPGGIDLPALTNFPANDVRINPGTYRVYDADVDGNPEVLKVELREGSAVDINIDGDGQKKKCPVP